MAGTSGCQCPDSSQQRVSVFAGQTQIGHEHVGPDVAVTRSMASAVDDAVMTRAPAPSSTAEISSRASS